MKKKQKKIKQQKKCKILECTNRSSALYCSSHQDKKQCKYCTKVFRGSKTICLYCRQNDRWITNAIKTIVGLSSPILLSDAKKILGASRVSTSKTS